MSLSITSGQADATQRQTLYGVVYALSGTLLSRISGLDPAPLRWATRTFSGGPTGEVYEAYLGLPDTIQEELPFQLGDDSPNHPIMIPIRNLPFRFADSLLAAIVDEEFAWEGSEATMFVGYLNPGQEPEDLAAEDWTTIRLNGQFGAPQEISQDSFRLPFYSRDSFRRQEINFTRAGRDDFPDIDPLDEGRVIPVVIGAPDSWIRMVRVSGGVYGLTTRSTLSGTSSGIEINSNFDGAQLSGLSGQQVYVHRQDKVLTVASVDVNPAGTAVLFFGSILDFNIPNGALIQQKLPYYDFLPCINGLVFNQFIPVGDARVASGTFASGVIAATAFETYDGRIIPFATVSGSTNFVQAKYQESPNALFPNGIFFGSGINVFTKWRMFDTLQPPALIPRLNLPSTGADVVSDDLVITDQPTFSPSVSTMEATKENFPTGPGGASAAFDGSLNTGFSLGAFGSVTFTFPSVTGGVFNNNDTTRSILRVTSQGDILYFNGITTFFHPTSASKDSYVSVQSSPRAFNQSITATAQTAGGGIVYEISWEHELATTLTIDRTTDVAGEVDVVLSSAEDVGFDMVPIKGIVAKLAHSNTDRSSFAISPWAGTPLGTPTHLGYRRMSLPTSVFAQLQKIYLEGGAAFNPQDEDSYTEFIDADSYAAAEFQYQLRNIRLNFAITEQIGWGELERELAWQSRSHAFFGPNGHQLIVIPDSSEAEEQTIEATFRLPGTPNPNTVNLDSALIERTPVSDIYNRVDIQWGRQWQLPVSADLASNYLFLTRGTNPASQAVFGDRFRIDGQPPAWAIHNVCVDATQWEDDEAIPPQLPYSGGDGQMLDLAEFIADRQAFARTRFNFETGWPAFGLTQGSIIRVAFAAAPGIYRNVVCEVENIQTSPINSERRNITARSIGAPQRGLEPALIWTDLFTELSDTWATRFTNVRDRWLSYFGVP